MILFSGIDLIVREPVDPQRVRSAVAGVLHVREERVSVIDDIGDYPSAEQADVVVVQTRSESDLSQVLSIQTEPLDIDDADDDTLLSRLCAALAVPLLAPDRGVDPYVMRLFQPGEPPRTVSIDPVAYEDGRYVVVDQPSSR